MKPLKLTIAGLHSFRREQTIDFTRVTDAGIFGIFGPTGSGKSSILDAITLALYGRVERSGGNRYGILNQHELQLHVALTFQISSSSGKNVYRVERTYKRKDGHSVQSSHARLIACTPEGDKVLEDRETAVNNGILRILGLSVDDFTRAVVLPQGKFEEFLKLKGKERRDMLERIFRLDAYGEALRKRLLTRLQSLESEVNRLESQQELLGEATSEAVKEAARQLEVAQGKLAEATRNRDAFGHEFEQWQKVRGHMRELRDVARREEELDARQGEMQVLEAALQTAARAERVSLYAATYREREQQLQVTKAALQEVQQAITAAAEEREQAQAAHRAAEEAWEREAPHLSERKVKLEEALEREKERAALDREEQDRAERLQRVTDGWQRAKTQVETAQQELAVLRTRAAELQQRAAELRVTTDERRRLRVAEAAKADVEAAEKQLTDAEKEATAQVAHWRVAEAAKADVEAAEKQLTDAEKEATAQVAHWRTQTDARAAAVAAEEAKAREWQTLREAVEGLKGQAPTTGEKLQQRERELHDYAYRVERLAQLEADRQKARRDVAALAKQLDDVRVRREQLDEQRQQCAAKLTAAETHLQELEKAQRARMEQHMAAQLAASLEAGSACPVCGATDHPHLAATGAHAAEQADEGRVHDEQLQRANEAVATLRQQLHQRQTDCSVLAETYTHRKAQREGAEQILAERHTKIVEQQQALPRRLQGATVPETEEHLRREQDNLQEERRKLAIWERDVAAKEEQLHAYQLAYHRLREQTATAEANAQHAAERAQTAEAAVAKWRERVATTRAKWEEVRGEWTFAGLAERLREVETFDRERETVEAARETLTGEQEATEQRLDDGRREEDKWRAATHDAEQQLRKVRERREGLTTAIDAITGGQPAAQLLAELVARSDELRQQLARTEEVLRTAEQTWQEASRQLSALEAKAEDHAAQLQLAEQQLNDKLATYQFASVAEVEAGTLQLEERERLSATLTEFREAQIKVASDRQRLQELLAGRTLTEEAWQEMTAKREALAEVWQAAQKAAISAEHAHRETEQNHGKWKVLEAERRKWQRQLDDAHDLQQVLKGKAFVEFVAREHLEGIAADASRHLGKLTRYRYALEIAQDGNFVMRDDGNGGMRRPVSTLSGGETFLTSLALALALSSQIQLKGECPLEFFFLDEGFGTLDPELLDVVITALEKLHYEHMTIGLISHVPELQNRLHRKIRVLPATVDEGTTVRIEYS